MSEIKESQTNIWNTFLPGDIHRDFEDCEDEEMRQVLNETDDAGHKLAMTIAYYLSKIQSSKSKPTTKSGYKDYCKDLKVSAIAIADAKGFTGELKMPPKMLGAFWKAESQEVRDQWDQWVSKPDNERGENPPVTITPEQVDEVLLKNVTKVKDPEEKSDDISIIGKKGSKWRLRSEIIEKLSDYCDTNDFSAKKKPELIKMLKDYMSS